MTPLYFHEENLAKHAVTPDEVREFLMKGKRKYLRKIGRRTYMAIAQTAVGRYLELIYRESGEDRFVFHAMDARPRYVKLLKRGGKRQ